MAKKPVELTHKQALFVEAYLANGGNATAAARSAGYKSPRQMGSENLTKPYIAEKIGVRIKEAAIQADEVMELLTKVARGFDPLKYTTQRDLYARDKSGEPYLIGTMVELNLDALEDDGLGWLIKSIKNTSYGPRYEFQDPMNALPLLAKHHDLLKEATSPVTVNLITPGRARELNEQATKELENEGYDE